MDGVADDIGFRGRSSGVHDVALAFESLSGTLPPRARLGTPGRALAISPTAPLAIHWCCSARRAYHSHSHMHQDGCWHAPRAGRDGSRIPSRHLRSSDTTDIEEVTCNRCGSFVEHSHHRRLYVRGLRNQCDKVIVSVSAALRETDIAACPAECLHLTKSDLERLVGRAKLEGRLGGTRGGVGFALTRNQLVTTLP